MKRVRKRLYALALAVVTAVVVVVVAPGAARADYVQLEGSPLFVGGFIGVHGNTTTWNLAYQDEKPDADCVYIKINIDRDWWPDTVYRSEPVCALGTGKGGWFTSDGVTLRFTQGARVYQCYSVPPGYEFCPHNQYVPGQ